MAIFAGTWKDAAGMPFDPNAYARRSAGDSHVAARRYTGNTNWNWRTPHNYALERAKYWWEEILDDDDKFLWKIASGNMNWARDFEMDIIGKPFTAFAMMNFAYFTTGLGIPIPSPTAEMVALDHIVFLTINTEEQGWSVIATYGSGGWLFEPACTWIYQIDPTRHQSRRAKRYTRCLTAFWEWDDPGRIYIFGGGVKWPFVSGDTLYFVATHRRGFYYQESIRFQGVAP